MTLLEACSPAPPSRSEAGSPSLPRRASWPHLRPGCWRGPATAPLGPGQLSHHLHPDPNPASSPLSQPPAPTPWGKAEKGARGPGASSAPPPPYPAQLSAQTPPPGITRLPGAPEEADHIPEGLMSGSPLPAALSRPPTRHRLSRPRPAHPSAQGPRRAWSQPGLGVSPTCASPACLL